MSYTHTPTHAHPYTTRIWSGGNVTFPVTWRASNTKKRAIPVAWRLPMLLARLQNFLHSLSLSIMLYTSSLFQSCSTPHLSSLLYTSSLLLALHLISLPCSTPHLSSLHYTSSLFLAIHLSLSYTFLCIYLPLLQHTATFPSTLPALLSCRCMPWPIRKD